MVLSIFLTFSNTVKLKPAGKPQLFDFEPTTYGDTRVLLNDSTPEGVDTLFLKLTSPVCVCGWVENCSHTHDFLNYRKRLRGWRLIPWNELRWNYIIISAELWFILRDVVLWALFIEHFSSPLFWIQWHSIEGWCMCVYLPVNWLVEMEVGGEMIKGDDMLWATDGLRRRIDSHLRNLCRHAGSPWHVGVNGRNWLILQKLALSVASVAQGDDKGIQ